MAPKPEQLAQAAQAMAEEKIPQIEEANEAAGIEIQEPLQAAQQALQQAAQQGKAQDAEPEDMAQSLNQAAEKLAEAAQTAQEEAAAANARALRFNHRQREHDGNRGIGGAASLAQDFGPRFGGARVGCADDAGSGLKFGLNQPHLRQLALGRRAASQHEGGDEEIDHTCGHGAGAYSLPTASAMQAKPSRCIRRSSPVVIARAIPGPR